MFSVVKESKTLKENKLFGVPFSENKCRFRRETELFGILLWKTALSRIAQKENVRYIS